MHSVNQELPGDCFSFSIPVDGAEGNVDCSYGVEFTRWTTRMDDRGYLGKIDEPDARRISESYISYGSPDKNHLWWLSGEDTNGDSDTASSPLCKNTGSLGKEMIGMIRDSLEWSYELSLRDLMDRPRMAKQGQKTSMIEVQVDKQPMAEKSTKKGKRRVLRNQSTDSRGFLLNMFLPASLSRRSFGATGMRSPLLPEEPI